MKWYTLEKYSTKLFETKFTEVFILACDSQTPHVDVCLAASFSCPAQCSQNRGRNTREGWPGGMARSRGQGHPRCLEIQKMNPTCTFGSRSGLQWPMSKQVRYIPLNTGPVLWVLSEAGRDVLQPRDEVKSSKRPQCLLELPRMNILADGTYCGYHLVILSL